MYIIKGELDASGIYLEEEIARFCAVYFKPKQRQSALDHQTMNAVLDPAVSRFSVLQEEDEDEAELWRGKVQAFRNLYGFLSQVIPYLRNDSSMSVTIDRVMDQLRSVFWGPVIS